MAEEKKPTYADLRKDHRAACKRHVIVIETDMDETQKRRTFAKADQLRQLGNRLAGTLQKRLAQLFRTKKYRALLKEYGDFSERLSKLPEDDAQYQNVLDAREKVSGKMKHMQQQYGLTMKAAMRKWIVSRKGAAFTPLSVQQDARISGRA